jgi:hypothetical protein
MVSFAPAVYGAADVLAFSPAATITSPHVELKVPVANAVPDAPLPFALVRKGLELVAKLGTMEEHDRGPERAAVLAHDDLPPQKQPANPAGAGRAAERRDLLGREPANVVFVDHRLGLAGGNVGDHFLCGAHGLTLLLVFMAFIRRQRRVSHSLRIAP